MGYEYCRLHLRLNMRVCACACACCVCADLALIRTRGGVLKTNLAGVGQSMNQYSGSWSVFINGQGMNVNLFSSNHSQGFQGMVGSPAASQTGSIRSEAVPDPAISSQLTTSAANLPSSSVQGASITSRSTQVAICYKMICQY